MIIEFVVRLEVADTNVPAKKIRQMVENNLFGEAQVLIAEGLNEELELEEDYYQLAINSVEVVKLKTTPQCAKQPA